MVRKDESKSSIVRALERTLEHEDRLRDYSIARAEEKRSRPKRTEEPIGPFRGPYRFLSNFHEAPFEWADEAEFTDGPVKPSVWPTAEHAFQAAKTLDLMERKRVRAASSPAGAKRLGRRVTLRPDWDRIKDDVMASVVLAKFAGNNSLRLSLMKTGERELVEVNNWGDRYWGVSRGEGRNQLGKTLMDVRDKLRRMGA